jgi:hypothetical protein
VATIGQIDELVRSGGPFNMALVQEIVQNKALRAYAVERTLINGNSRFLEALIVCVPPGEDKFLILANIFDLCHNSLSAKWAVPLFFEKSKTVLSDSPIAALYVYFANKMANNPHYSVSDQGKTDLLHFSRVLESRNPEELEHRMRVLAKALSQSDRYLKVILEPYTKEPVGKQRFIDLQESYHALHAHVAGSEQSYPLKNATKFWMSSGMAMNFSSPLLKFFSISSTETHVKNETAIKDNLVANLYATCTSEPSGIQPQQMHMFIDFLRQIDADDVVIDSNVSLLSAAFPDNKDLAACARLVENPKTRHDAILELKHQGSQLLLQTPEGDPSPLKVLAAKVHPLEVKGTANIQASHK